MSLNMWELCNIFPHMCNLLGVISTTFVQFQNHVKNKHLGQYITTQPNWKNQKHISLLKSSNIYPKQWSLKPLLKSRRVIITVSSLDAGEELAEKASPFHTYIQIIDGFTALNIAGKKYNLKLGDGIIIPAHTRHNFNANEQFKIVTTVIKSAYVD